jgi:hypothetical protein
LAAVTSWMRGSRVPASVSPVTSTSVSVSTPANAD